MAPPPHPESSFPQKRESRGGEGANGPPGFPVPRLCQNSIPRGNGTATPPRVVIPAEAGIQGWGGGERPAWIPVSQAVSRLHSNRKWHRRPTPSRHSRGSGNPGAGRGRTARLDSRFSGCVKTPFQQEMAPPPHPESSFPRKRESRGGEGANGPPGFRFPRLCQDSIPTGNGTAAPPRVVIPRKRETRGGEGANDPPGFPLPRLCQNSIPTGNGTAAPPRVVIPAEAGNQGWGGGARPAWIPVSQAVSRLHSNRKWHRRPIPSFPRKRESRRGEAGKHAGLAPPNPWIPASAGMTVCVPRE